jgi:predicted nucleic acid-binding protein
MASKVFADANLLLDFTLKRENYEAAREMIQHSIDGVIQIYITPSVLHIAAYWTTKAYGPAKSKMILLALLADVHIIDCDHATALVAINSNMNDIEDALQYYNALKFGMDYFISSDKNLKKAAIPQLPIYTDSEFLNDLR